MTNISYFYSDENSIDMCSVLCYYTFPINSRGFIKAFLVVHKEPSKTS